MTEENEQQKRIMVYGGVADLVKLYMQQFGSLTFGTLTLMLVWWVMVLPQLERNKTDGEFQRLMLEELRRITDDQKEMVPHMKQTSEILDRITIRLDSQ